MAIESDVRNADSQLVVRFYKRPVEIKDETIAQGRPIFKDMDFITIMTPGDQLNIIDTIAEERHKRRFPLHWADFQNKTANHEGFTGTPLSEWPLLTMSQAEELKALKFYTVEAVANCNDQQLQRIGMIAGMSPYAFRDKAKSFLSVASKSAEVSKREEELEQLKAENAKIKLETDAKLAAMQEQMTALLATVGTKKPRKTKVDLEA